MSSKKKQLIFISGLSDVIRINYLCIYMSGLEFHQPFMPDNNGAKKHN